MNHNIYFIILSTCTFSLRLESKRLSANNLTNINPCIFTVPAHSNDHLVWLSFRSSFHITFTFLTILTTLLRDRSASGRKDKMSLTKSNFLMLFGTFWLHLKPPISYCSQNVRYFCLTFDIQVSFLRGSCPLCACPFDPGCQILSSQERWEMGR